MTTKSVDRCPFKLASASFRNDPYPVLSEMRTRCSATPVEANGYRMWLVSRYADARRMLGDPGLCKDIVQHRHRVVPQCVLHPQRSAHIPHASRRSLIDRDGAEHRRLRSVVRRALARKLVIEQKTALETLATKILVGLPRDRVVELAGEYARPLCMTFISDLYGIPTGEALEFPKWDNELLTGSSIEEVERGGRELYQFGLRMINFKKQEPGDDIFTELLQSHLAGELEIDELASTYIVLMLGAGEVANAIASGVFLLLSEPRHYRLLSGSPDLVANCVDEILRYESPFRLLPPRFSDQDVRLEDVVIPQGELIVVSPAAANRDPARFFDPDCFDPMRRTNGHLAFGYGVHACPGALFARMQMEVAIRLFVSHFQACRLACPSEEVLWRGGDFMRRLSELPVVLSPLCSEKGGESGGAG